MNYDRDEMERCTNVVGCGIGVVGATTHIILASAGVSFSGVVSALPLVYGFNLGFGAKSLLDSCKKEREDIDIEDGVIVPHMKKMV